MGVSIIQNIEPFTASFKLLVTDSMAYRHKDFFKNVHDIQLFGINIYEGNGNEAK